jgi:hypothetical protein
MKTICPSCGQPITLDNVEEIGVGNGYCSKCKIYLHATYEKKGKHEFWTEEYEKYDKRPNNPKPDSFEKFLSRTGYLAITILLAYLMATHCGPQN